MNAEPTTTTTEKDVLPIGHSEEVLTDTEKKYIDQIDDIIDDIHLNNPELVFSDRIALQKERLGQLKDEYVTLSQAATTPDSALELAIRYADQRLKAMDLISNR